MQAASLSLLSLPTTSLSSTSPLVKPLQIDFCDKEVEARLILVNPEIQAYALNVLKEIRLLSEQITNEIRPYNEGNVSYREAIDDKIQTILRNHIATKSFPLIPLVAQLKSLKAFFNPIREECRRLKGELFQLKTEMENARKMLLEEKDRKLSLLLNDEQEKISSLVGIMGHFFNTLKEEIADKNTKPTVYFAYAWPTDERMRDEFWVQTFLKKLQRQLERVGIHTVRLDIVSNRYGANIYEFMKKAQTSDYVLLFGTKSLKDKHDIGLSAVCTELIHILRKRQLDVKKGLRRVFPILISGCHQTAFPLEYERYITVRDWRRGGGYLHHFQSLFLELFRLPPKRYLQLSNGFLNESIEAFPEEVSALHRVQGLYGHIRQQISCSTSLEEVKQLPATLLFEVEPPNRLMDVRQRVIEKLKQCYLSQSEVTIFTVSEKGEWELSMPIDSLYTQLVMITEEERLEKRRELENKVVDGRLPTHETIFKTKKEVSPNEILTQAKSDQETRVMVFGSAGVGKTTFINYMLYTWAKGKYWNEKFQAIFSIRLRNLNEYFYPKIGL
ncbi:MAG: NACHT domain-containing protein [Chlamydiales bacterium]